MALNKTKISHLVKEFGGSEKNTGAIEVQIAILTEEINELTNHLLKHKKDNISKRGLFIKVSHRKSLISYLESRDVNRAREIIKKLKIRA